MKNFLSAILLFLAFVACEETFDSPPRAELVAQVRFSSGAANDNPKITVYGVGKDSIWINQMQTNEFNLPLSPDKSSSFVVMFDSIPDTMTVFHENTINYESVESGFYYEYRIENIIHTYHRIDSTVVLDSAITQSWNENITIYITDLPADTDAE
ncbi:MAG: DUF6452 family protein [Prolixibacteraceae bacterium]